MKINGQIIPDTNAFLPQSSTLYIYYIYIYIVLIYGSYSDRIIACNVVFKQIISTKEISQLFLLSVLHNIQYSYF